MKRMKYDLFATLLILILIASPAHAANLPSGDGLSEEEMERVDNAPMGCVRDDKVILPDGKSLYDHQKANGKTSTTNAAKKEYDRLESIKLPGALGGQDFGAPYPEHRRLTARQISMYDKPGGRLIGTFPEKFAVVIVGQKGDWALVQGYWSRPCERGWTQKKNLVEKTTDELKALGVFLK